MKDSSKTKIKLPELSRYGIEKPDQIFYNLSYDELFQHETSDSLEGYEKGFVTNLGAVNVDTGIFTGRSPKDKYIVQDSETSKNIWWATPGRKSSDNKPISEDVWKHMLNLGQKQLSGKKLYVMDAFCGANANTRIKIRVITEVAWAAHFVKNMFIRPTEEELKDFTPDFVMLHACKTVNPQWHEQGLNSDVFVAFNLKERMAVVGGTWYGGEIKKGFFSVMNYFLPLQGIASMHCSANMGKNGDTAIFFGLSGTGKTTLSADPDRYLIGDDEHGWDDEGIFNFEGGCYAKCINLDKDKEPDIYEAIKKDALLENLVYNDKTGEIDFRNNSKTENTRVSYPINHIRNIVTPVSKGGHPKKIIFLSADAFGVLPPVAKLTEDQAMYYFLSGYTSKLAGTERGIKEPVPTFSSAFGAAFLLLHPTVYAKELARKMKEHGATAYLVNTGWTGGPYGTGHRIDLPVTRKIIKSILDGSLDNAEYEELPEFGLFIPKEIKGVDSSILNPRNTWKYPSAYEKQAQELAEKFIENFQNFTDNNEGKRLVAAGPKNIYMKEFYDFYLQQISILKKEQTDEILRLKDQIYILQNAFNEYISFNSINSNYKNRKLTRHVPMNVFIGTDDEKRIKAIHDKMMALVDVLGFRFYNPNKKPLHMSERMCVSKEEITIQEVYDKFYCLYDAIYSKKYQSAEMEEVVIEFLNEAAKVNEVTVKIGSLLLVQKPGEHKRPEITALKLSISNMIHLDKNPKLLKDPVQLLKELHSF